MDSPVSLEHSKAKGSEGQEGRVARYILTNIEGIMSAFDTSYYKTDQELMYSTLQIMASSCPGIATLHG